MNRSRTALVTLLAAVLIITAAGAVLATGGSAAPAGPAAPAPAAASPTATPSAPATPGPKGAKVQRDDVLTGVLDDLVKKGTLTEAQEQAILDGITAERTARQEARKAAQAQAKADRQQLRDFLADGVITKAEFDKLPVDSPLRAASKLMDDGKITTDELKSLGRGMFGGGMFGGGKVHGNVRDRGWNKVAPSGSPSTGG